jgi:hypothetical protein
MNMEEKKPKKTKKTAPVYDEVLETETLSSQTPVGETVKDDVVPQKNAGKTAYKVILVRPHIVVYRVLDGTNSFTENIWGMNLKKDDIIYL